jgi:uncharacterized protein (DUF1697 family)
MLRAIANVPMAPLREALETLGFDDVESYGMSGNLLFDAGPVRRPALERRIGKHLGTDAFVRTRRQLERVLSADPHGEDPNAILMFLGSEPAAERRAALEAADFDGHVPVLDGTTIHFLNPTVLRGNKTLIDFERFLGVRGTFRTKRVIEGIVRRMKGGS